MTMAQNFEAFLTALLESYETNPAQDIDELIIAKCKEWGLTDEQVATLKEALGYIDEFSEKNTSLEEAKAGGKSRKQWLMEQMDEVTDGRTEEEKAQIISAISETNEQMIEEITTKD